MCVSVSDVCVSTCECQRMCEHVCRECVCEGECVFQEHV